MRTLGVFALVLLLLVSSGCTFQQHLAHHAVDYNKTVEEVQNRMLLLNIIRASKRRPMYFTGIGSITAAPSYTVNAGGGSLAEAIGTKFDGAGLLTELSDTDTGTFTLPGGSYTNKPTMQVGVLDTQEFFTGILSQVTADEVSHYLSQGWSTELLAYLLVERVEMRRGSAWLDDLENCYKPDAKLVVLKNDPTVPTEFGCFQKLITKVRGDFLCRLHKTATTREPFHRSVALTPSLKDLIAAEDAGVVVREQPSSAALSEARPRFSLSKRVMSWKFECSTESGTQAADPAYIGVRSLEEAREDDPSKKNKQLKTAFVFRSPQAILYYLGEIVRAIDSADGSREITEKDGRIPFVEVTGYPEPIPLFWAVKAKDSSCSGVEVSIDYGGSTYLVPSQTGTKLTGSCRANGSMRSLTLVSQLLSLHKKAKDLPGTALVRVVGD